MITNTELEYKGNLYPNQIVDYIRDKDKFYFTTENGVVLELTVIQDRTVRFRYATEQTFEPDFSYAVNPLARRGYSHLEVLETTTEYIVETAKLQVLVDKKTLRCQISDLDGNITMEKEALTLESLAIATAAKNANGFVIVQVERIADITGKLQKITRYKTVDYGRHAKIFDIHQSSDD